MTFRPTAARWFELVTVHRDLARTMERLSRTGAVQLEARSGRGERLTLAGLDEELEAYRDLARRYRPYWPAITTAEKRPAEQLGATLTAARRCLEGWAAEADPIIAAIEQTAHEIAELQLLEEALAHVGPEFPDLKLLVAAGPRLRACLLRLPPDTRLREIPSLVLYKSWQAPTASCVLVVGRETDIAEIEARLPALKGRVVALPPWLPSATSAALTAIAQQRARLERETRARNDELRALSERARLASALGDLVLVEWLHSHAKDLRASEHLAWVTGWTSDPDGAELRRALDAEGVRYVLRLADGPTGSTAPMVLHNPAWVRGFEIFARMLGTPDRDESDPSIILAVIVPVIFGFMFGDIGQGMVIFAAGLVLGRRLPLLWMLVPGGLMAVVFGLLFGSVFCRDDLIPALWLRPFADPITILVAAVGLGAVVLVIGMMLDAVQAHWRGEALRWWGYRVGLAVTYVGLLLAPLWTRGLAVAAVGAAWYVVGATVLAPERRVATPARAAAELIEELLRILVNTVSFARVGAFALAHAGLSIAIVEIAAATGPVGYWIVLALGNVLAIALEGFVVGIQTTRLMLFEFFMRFLTAGGREFQPLPPPAISDHSAPQPSTGGTA